MQVKASFPATFLSGDTLPIIQVYFEFNHLKNLYRQGWLNHGVPPARCESVAEHSMGVALLCLFLADAYFPELDVTKFLRMALLHDVGEIYAGDVAPGDGIPADQKYRLERASIQRVLSKLPNGPEYIEIWEEFERAESAEAKFVRQVDRLEMGLQASVYAHQGVLDPTEFYETVRAALSSPQLQAVFEALEALRS